MQGKTLAFVLPILESLTNGPTKSSRKTGYGKPPSVLVLLPTRELACQVQPIGPESGFLKYVYIYFHFYVWILDFARKKFVREMIRKKEK